jgi:Zn finger protein HypA/HybF involved in hydrogenase expression
MIDTKKCTKCGNVKPLSEFGRHRLTKDKHAYRCKQCAREHSKKHRQTPSGIYSIVKGRHNFYNRKPFNISKEDFIEWYTTQERVCVYCDIPEEHTHLLDHSYGQKSKRLTVECKDNDLGYVVGNLALACYKCNYIKLDVFSSKEMREIAQKFLKPKWIELVSGSAKNEM